MGRRKLTTDEWISNILDRFPKNADKYDYSKAVYTGNHNELVIICKEHGEFKQMAHLHYQGKGCPVCGNLRMRSKLSLDTKDFITKSKAVHGDLYDYSRVVYEKTTIPVEIICKKHGSFTQLPYNHLKGHGCPVCRLDTISQSNSLSEAEFLKSCTDVHKGFYDYSKVVYKGSEEKICIICPKHGEFWQMAYEHKKGTGCPACAKAKHISDLEAEVYNFVKTICSDAEQSNRTILDDGKELDIFVPSKHVAIEVNGIYWHGDNHKPTNYHYLKWQVCKEKGIRLIQITDYDWENNQEKFKHLIAHALGVDSGRKVNARDCEVVHLTSKECKVFYNTYHPQGHSPNPINLALRTKRGGDIVAIMSFGFGKTTRGQARANGTTKATWELSRFATCCTVRGGASKLFKAFIREKNPEEVSSFSMNDYFAGGVYEVLGFVAETYGKPDYRVFHHANGLRPKPHWQRRLIPKRLEEIGRSDVDFNPDKSIDPRTEREIEDLVGAIRLWDSGKIKWVWKPENN